MGTPCKIWPVLVALLSALVAATAISGPAQAGSLRASAARTSPGTTQEIVITSSNVGSPQHAIFDLAGLAPGQTRSLPISVRNESGTEVTVRLTQVAFHGDAGGVLQAHSTVTLLRDGTVLGTGGAISPRLMGASTLIAAGATSELTAEVSLPSSAGHPVVQGHSLTAEFSFSVMAGSAPIQGGITVGSGGVGLPPTAESLTVFHGLVWASLTAFAAALVLGLLLAFRRRPEDGEDRESGGGPMPGSGPMAAEGPVTGGGDAG